MYPESEVARLKLISRSKLLGLSLKEIKEILDYAAAGSCNTAQTRLSTMIGEKINEIDTRIAQLVALKADLRRYEGELAYRAKEGLAKTGGESLADCSCVGASVVAAQK